MTIFCKSCGCALDDPTLVVIHGKAGHLLDLVHSPECSSQVIAGQGDQEDQPCNCDLPPILYGCVPVPAPDRAEVLVGTFGRLLDSRTIEAGFSVVIMLAAGYFIGAVAKVMADGTLQRFLQAVR